MKTFLKVNFPLWFRLMYYIGGPIVLGLICTSLFRLGQQGFTAAVVLKGGFLLLIVAAGCYIIPIFFSTVCANEFGVELRRFTKTKEKFTWNEIQTVVRPRFGIPYDVAYIVSRNGKRIPIARGMSGYDALLQLIQSKAPNLSPNQLAANLHSPAQATSWRQFLVFLAIFIAYIIFRSVTR